MCRLLVSVVSVRGPPRAVYIIGCRQQRGRMHAGIILPYIFFFFFRCELHSDLE